MLGILLLLSTYACSSSDSTPAPNGTATAGAATGGESEMLGSAGSSVSGAGNAGAPSSGGAGANNAGGAASDAVGAAAGSSGATSGAGAGATASGGAAGAAGAAEPEGDIPPPHPLSVTASKALHSHSFLPKDADPTVSAKTFSGTNKEIAQVDPRAATMIGKLVVNLGGQGSTGAYTGGAGSFAAERGFHVFSVAYYANYDVLQNDADYYGDARLEEFDGQDHTSKYATRDNMPSEKLGLSPADGVEQRVRLGLAYLAKNYANEDWSYFLTADGAVRWSDVIFTGVSHGASSAVRFAMLVRASRAVALSGPRDNTCLTTACTESSAVIATWFSETPKTPSDRLYGLSGGKDAQHTQHLVAFEKLGLVGAPVDVDSNSAPYSNSHRLESSSASHDSFCDNAKYKDACNYLFGVPAENAAGVK